MGPFIATEVRARTTLAPLPEFVLSIMLATDAYCRTTGWQGAGRLRVPMVRRASDDGWELPDPD